MTANNLLRMESELSLTQKIGLGGIITGIAVFIIGLQLLLLPIIPFDIFPVVGMLFCFMGSIMVIIMWVTQFGIYADNPIVFNYEIQKESTK